MEVHGFTVGPIGENTYLIAGTENRAVIVDPGEEAPRLLAAIEEQGLTLEAILLTHCHFDHVGAVAPVARATGAPVYCPIIEVPVLQDINAYVRFPGFGPFENWDPEQTVAGGETLRLAGLEFEVLFTPGHSPGHVTYAVAATDDAPSQLFAGDVLFAGSIGRTDLPFGDHDTLLQSIAGLLERFEDDAVV